MAATTHPNIDLRDHSLSGARDWFARKGLSRPGEGRVVAGVFAAFARRYDVNPLVARLLGLAVVVTLTPLVYVGAWILMPSDVSAAPETASPA
jgi:phage shock protein C